MDILKLSLKDKTEIQKMEFFGKSDDKELLETIKCIDPEREIDSFETLIAKVNTLLLPQEKSNLQSKSSVCKKKRKYIEKS